MAKKILFIEDEPDQVMLVKTRLESYGYSMDSAADGEEGLKKAVLSKPDLVLLDVILPKINGFEVCKRLKKDQSTKNMPVVIITATGEKDASHKAFAAGADDFISKPYDSSELVAKIKKLIK